MNQKKTTPQLNQQLAVQEEQLRLKEMRINQLEAKHKLAGKLGDFSFDTAKLIIGGVILAGLMKKDIDYWLLFMVGVVVVLLFMTFGVSLINYSNRKER